MSEPEWHCKSRGPTDRTGLYIMMILILLKSCDIEPIYDKVGRIEDKLDRLQKQIEEKPK